MLITKNLTHWGQPRQWWAQTPGTHRWDPARWWPAHGTCRFLLWSDRWPQTCRQKPQVSSPRISEPDRRLCAGFLVVLGVLVRFVIGRGPVLGPLQTLIDVVANQIVGFFRWSPLDEDRSVCLPGGNHLAGSRGHTCKQHNLLSRSCRKTCWCVCRSAEADGDAPLSSCVSMGPVGSDGSLHPYMLADRTLNRYCLPSARSNTA